MKKMCQTGINVFCAVALAVILSACGAKIEGNVPFVGEGDISDAKNPISVDDFEWSITQGEDKYGKHTYVSYTNNSDYDVVLFFLRFEEKRYDLPEETRNAYLKKVQAATGRYEEVLNAFDLDLVCEAGDCFPSEILHLVKKGATDNVIIYGSHLYNTQISEEDLETIFDPARMTVSYVDGDKIKTVTYYFPEDSYEEDDEILDAYYWPENELFSSVPRPDKNKVSILDEQEDDYFDIDILDISQTEFENYVEKCKEMGYTTIIRADDGYYRAENENSEYMVTVNYLESLDTMTIFAKDLKQ